jgi:hypothetical protein
VAQALLDQQLAVFEGVGMQLSHTPGLARRWGQAVWLDWQVRQRLENRHLKSKCTRDALYVESLRFAGLMGLSPQRLPVTLAEFDAWAEYSLQAWPASGYQGMALECVTGLTPVFWPANLALILYLLPETFWGRYGAGLELEGRKLAGQVRGMMEVLSEL